MTDRLGILHVADAPRPAATPKASAAVGEYALGLGDDALILAQRLGEWISNAPELEEDVALGNIGLDLLGHARALLTYAGSATGRSEDDLAYFRDEAQFRSRWIFELPNGDFAVTVCRQLVVSAYFCALYRRLAASGDPMLAAIAAKAVKEVAYHAEHAGLWTRRLGMGTEESHRRMQRALTDLWPFIGELFADDPAAATLPGVAVSPEELRDEVLAAVETTVRDAGLDVPTVPFLAGGGRTGRHSESFGRLIAEMQVLARAHPGATW
jgi:ring-1,2-phenylacetyl-CoA epoxidase subunit PaaC